MLAAERDAPINQRRYGPITIIQGGATGADALAKERCYRQPNVTLISVPANSLISVKAYIYPQHQFAVVGDRTFKAAISFTGVRLHGEGSAPPRSRPRPPRRGMRQHVGLQIDLDQSHRATAVFN